MSRSGIIFISSIVLILLTSWFIVGNLTPYGSATTSDSLAYLDIANNIKNGNGVLATDFSLDNVGKHTLVLKKYWPPLYASLLSVYIDNASDVMTVSFISRILLAISIIFIFLITYEAIGSVAFISSLLLCVTVPIITIYTYAWSETLFLPIFIITIWSSIKYLEFAGQSKLYRAAILLILLTSLIMLAYTRYIGIVFIILLPVIYFLSNRDRLDKLLLSTAFFIYTATVGYLLYGNYIVSGHISGMARPPSDKSLVENLIDVYHVVLAVIPSSALLILTALMVAGLIVYFIKTNTNRTTNTADKHSFHRVFILTIATFVYLITIFSLRSIKQFDMLDVRLLTPAFVTLYMLIAILPSFFKINNKTGMLVYFISFFFITSLSFNGYKQWLDTSKNWKALETPNLRLNSDLVYTNFTKSLNTKNKTNKLFSSLTQDGGVIVVKKALRYEFITGVRCVEKPENIDAENFLKINSLPAGSLLLVHKPEFDQIINKYIRRNSIYKYINIGNIMALQLPVKSSIH